MASVEFKDVKKIYKTGEVVINALSDATFEIEKGEFCVVLGASGAGKTTMLNILGGMDTLSEGEIFLDGEKISSFSNKQLVEYRRHSIGFVFQFYNLVPNLTAIENVELAAQICSDPLDADAVMDAVGLKDRKTNFPAQLSGGEQQRVAIARALAKNPKLLQDTCRKSGMTVVIITHNSALEAMADRVIKLNSGKVTEVYINENPMDVESIEW